MCVLNLNRPYQHEYYKFLSDPSPITKTVWIRWKSRKFGNFRTNFSVPSLFCFENIFQITKMTFQICINLCQFSVGIHTNQSNARCLRIHPKKKHTNTRSDSCVGKQITSSFVYTSFDTEVIVFVITRVSAECQCRISVIIP